MTDLHTLHPAQIVVYTTESCPDCHLAKAFLRERGVPFHEVQLETDSRAADFIARLNRGCLSVPTIIFPDGTRLVEASIRELKDRFNA